MMSRAGVALLAVVACCVTTAASAQNNADELGNINAANGIEDNSNEVLDNEELNSNSNNMNSNGLGNNSNPGVNSNGGGNVSNLNNAMGTNGNTGNNSGINGNGNPNNSLPLNSSGDGNVGLNNGGGRNNFSTPSLPGVPSAPGNVTGKNTGTATPLPLTNGGNKATNGTTATPPPDAALPPNAAEPPGEDDAPALPPSPDGTAGAAPEEPTETPPAESERPKKLSREERRQQKLDVARKLAEAIPALRPGEGPPEYVVQPGDTLWDISDQLLDDPMWWPRLWVLNPEVTDPDKLEPGLKLLFYPSDAGKAPELVIKEQFNPFGEPRINPATLQTFSLKAERWTGKNGEIMEISSIPGDQNLLTSGEQGATATYLFQLPGFLTNAEIDSVGEILSTPNSPLIAGQGQRIIASFNGRSPSPGERFVAVRHSTVLKEMDSKYSTMDLYNYTGVLGVARAGADGNAVLVAEDPNSFVSPNDLLLPLNKSLLVAIEPGAPGRPNNAPAFVLASEQGNAIHAGPGMAVFLQGINSNNPFAVGDDVELFMPLAGTFGYSDEFMDRESVAVARIVDANSDSAVGVIIRASREVSSGASTRPDLIP
ncbi:MAG: LysM peptidoglycan-binding domain-containing protein [Betaproteobacteria bacterium]|nr:LysM peptidoglycan-binding domain-containing protein [Betaproteobacteria bacterium]